LVGSGSGLKTLVRLWQLLKIAGVYKERISEQIS